MFQKSFQILVVCALLTLAAIVGYALLRFAGPEDALARAQAKFAAGSYGEVIADLDLAERGAGVAGSPALQEQLWRLRSQAYEQLQNPRGALDDVRRLLQSGHADDEDLLLREVSLLARAGEGAQAVARGRAFLKDHPDDSRALELTGEACQTIYQPLLLELQVTLERELGQSRRAESRQQLLAYLYRPDGDAEIERAAARLEEMFRSEARLIATWPDVWQRARTLRERVQEGLGFFERSLDLGGEPVAAFRAVATALEQSGRVDDLLIAAEIQRRMFDHLYVAESGALASWARLQAGLPRAAMTTVDRWLTEAEVDQRALDGKLGPAAQDLALARALANWRLQDVKSLRATSKLVSKLREQGLDTYAGMWAVNLIRRTLRSSPEPEQTEKLISRLTWQAMQAPPPFDRPDLVAEFQPVLLESMQARNAPEGDVLEALKQWRTTRPEQAEPRIRTANYLWQLGRTTAALAALADAVKVAPKDPRLFPLRVEISEDHYESTGQSGPSLFAQCVQNREPIPDIEDPIGYVLCAEAALTQPGKGAAQLALTNARAAIGAFPQANRPRQLELRALLALQRHEEAAKTADLTVRAIVPDAETLRLAIEAKQQAGEPLRQLARVAMPRVARSPSLQAALLGIAVEDSPATAVQFVDPGMFAAEAPLEPRILAIRALVHAGRLDEATTQLKATRRPAKPEQQALLLGAFTEWLLASAERLDDDALYVDATGLRDHLALARGPQQALLASLPSVAERHPKTALALLDRALAAAAPEERSGALYALAGSLAAGQGDLVRAEARWLAALGFAGGFVAAEPLARMLVLQGRDTRAAKVYSLVNAPTDPALAARMGKLPVAGALVAAQLQQDPADLLVHATLATFGQTSLVDWVAPGDPELQLRRLELLSGLRDPAMAALTLPRAEALMRADPSKQTHFLLLARASADAQLHPAAAALHLELFKAGLLNPVLLREVAYAGQDEAYVPDKAIATKLMEAVSNGGTAGSLLTLRYGMQQIVKGFEAGGFPEMAEKTRLAQWLAAPQLQSWTEDDLRLITTGYPAAQACQILDKILQGPHAGDRARLLDAFYPLAEHAVVADPKLQPALTAMATRHLAADGARGDLVHFLLDHGAGAASRDAAALLAAHLQAVGEGRDDAGELRRTTARLIEEVGLVMATNRVDEVLDLHPTSLPLWALRTRLHVRLRDDDDALASMRMVLSHAQDPAAELSFFALAAAERDVTEADVARLAELPETLRASPTGRYVQALFALRSGDPSAALEHFPAAAPQHDGRHLFLWALAELEAADGPENGPAVALFQQLEADYPSSPLAQYAGSFLRQLSPR